MNDLREAVRAGDEPLVAQLLAGASASLNISQPEDRGPTPLHWAASHGHAAIAKLLLDHDNGKWAAVSQQEDGKTALQLACKHGQAECAAAILANLPGRVKPSVLLGMRDEQGMTALLYGALAGSGPTCAVLLAAAGEAAAGLAEAVDSAGRAPLHLAALHDNPALVRGRPHRRQERGGGVRGASGGGGIERGREQEGDRPGTPRCRSAPLRLWILFSVRCRRGHRRSRRCSRPARRSTRSTR